MRAKRRTLDAPLLVLAAERGEEFPFDVLDMPEVALLFLREEEILH